MSIIIKHNGLYLDRFYKLQPIPDLFPEWHLDAIINCMGSVHVARVGAGVIDLDRLEFERIEV